MAAPDADAVFERLEASLATAELPGSLKGPLVAFLKTSNRDLDRWRSQVEWWFDDKMDRLSGWYKRRTKWILFVIGIVLVGSLNADTVLFARTLWNDATLRQSVTAQAQHIAATPVDCQKESATKDNPAACAAKLLKDVQDLHIPLGWTANRPEKWGWEWVLKVVGLVLTALALSLGAPFWFDLLNKVTNFRATGAPAASSTPTPTPTPEPAPKAGST